LLYYRRLTSALQRTAATLGGSAALDFTTRLMLADGFRQRRSLKLGRYVDENRITS
jgi:hypothetical protein